MYINLCIYLIFVSIYVYSVIHYIQKRVIKVEYNLNHYKIRYLKLSKKVFHLLLYIFFLYLNLFTFMSASNQEKKYHLNLI